MIRAIDVIPAGEWRGPPADTVELDREQRHRRRVTMIARGNTQFLLDLPAAVVLRHGDGLVLDDGRIIAVEGVPEPLARIVAPSAALLLRLAWHLGNRHLPAAIHGDHILIRRDHVIEAMVVGVGGAVTHVEEPFEPEGGAYAEHPPSPPPPPPPRTSRWRRNRDHAADSATATSSSDSFAHSHSHSHGSGGHHHHSHDSSSVDAGLSGDSSGSDGGGGGGDGGGGD